MKNLISLFIAAAALLIYSSTFVVDERRKGLVQRFGEIQRTVDEPGLYFKLPFIETVSVIPDTILVWENNDMQIQDKNNEIYNVDAVTLARIKDVRKFREILRASVSEAETRVGTLLDAALRQTYGRRSFDDSLTAQRSQIMREIRDQLRTVAEPLGIEIVDVRVRRTDLNERVLQQTYDRMKAERNALAADIRANGEATKTKVIAETDRAFIEKTADAKRRSEIIRGEGDSERNRIFAEAFQRDPEFFAFYRSMQAYQNALANGDSTMVLNPQSEFFKYFQNPSATPQQ